MNERLSAFFAWGLTFGQCVCENNNQGCNDILNEIKDVMMTELDDEEFSEFNEIFGEMLEKFITVEKDDETI